MNSAIRSDMRMKSENDGESMMRDDEAGSRRWSAIEIELRESEDSGNGWER